MNSLCEEDDGLGLVGTSYVARKAVESDLLPLQGLVGSVDVAGDAARGESLTSHIESESEIEMVVGMV